MESIIAKNIKIFLNEKNLTVKTLSDMSKLDFGFIRAVVDGKYMPTIAEITSIAEVLGIAVYQLLLPQPNFLSSWHISLEELDDMVAQNPSLRGFMVGYMTESKLRSYFSACSEISNIYKPDDHDRSNKCDLVLSYMGREFTFEIKSLQTNTVKTCPDGNGFEATFQCDASDRRFVKLPNGHDVNTTCLKFGDFDILAVNLFAFTGQWCYGFALNRDLPHATQGRGRENVISEEDAQYLIKSSIHIKYPLCEPFVLDPFILMRRMLQDNHLD